MALDPAAIVALGMVTPLGHGADASAAALRAGLTRFAELPEIEIEGAPIVGAPIRSLTDGLVGLERFASLAAAALRDLLDRASLDERALASTRLYLALPNDGLAPVAARIADQCGVSALAKRSQVFPAGHAGAIAALAQAMKDLARGGRAIVGGVDSLLDPATVTAYHQRGRLKHGDRPTGLMPGEAAAFFLIEPLPQAKAPSILATIEAPATATERVTIDGEGVCDASGLTEACRRTLGALSDGGKSLGLLVADLNGEAYRSEEYAYLIARALCDVVETPYRLWHPADSIGDTGAASAAISICAAARALQRGYARTSDVLVLASSEGGLRGTAILRKHQGKG